MRSAPLGPSKGCGICCFPALAACSMEGAFPPSCTHISLPEMRLQSQPVFAYRQGLFDFWAVLVLRGFKKKFIIFFFLPVV